MSRKRVTYRPNKASGIMGGIMGGIFVLLGIFVVIPTFGPFGILWTLVAAAICGGSLYQSFGKKYIGPQIEIEEDPTENRDPVEKAPGSAPDLHAKERLEQLEELRTSGLISDEEYEKKRKTIVDRL